MKYTVLSIAAAALLLSGTAKAQEATQPQNAQSPAKQADCTQTTNPLDNKHVKVTTPPAFKRHIYKMLGSLSSKAGISLNPNDVDPATIAKKASKPCPAPAQPKQ